MKEQMSHPVSGNLPCAARPTLFSFSHRCMDKLVNKARFTILVPQVY